MSDVKIGEILTGCHERDAIHIAIAPVFAAETLKPGQEVGFVGDGSTVGFCTKPFGIVDPFLKASVAKGERFYAFLFPNTVTGMRHEWEHPAFAERANVAIDPEGAIQREREAAVKASVAWLKKYVAKVCPYDTEYGEDVAYDRFIDRIKDDGEMFYSGSDLHGSYEVEDADEVYQHLSIVLGRPIRPENLSFSCSC